MAKQIIFILVPLFFLGFQAKYQVPSAQKSFKEKISSVKILSLPAVFNCRKEPESDSSQSPIESLTIPSCGCYLVGRVFPNDQFISLIYAYIGDNNYPVIFTYTREGKRIDSLFISGGCGGVPYDCFTRYSTRIDYDHTITIIDSMGNYRLDANENIIPGTESGTATIKEYKVDNKGHFVLINQKKRKIH
jgi:hypothetical protein